MGFPLTDITLYATTPHIVGTSEYDAEIAVENFICDLYHRKMNGYKPPHTSRITLQPAYHNDWKEAKKLGSIVSVAPYFNYDEYKVLTRKEQYRYLLELIHGAMLQLCSQFKWDKPVFENAYKEILAEDFRFRIDYPAKLSRDKKNTANLSIEKTETLTSTFVNIHTEGRDIKMKLFEKRNSFWYDCAYELAKYNKWFDKDRFGIYYDKGKIEVWYSIEKDEVARFESGVPIAEIDFRKHFYMQLP